VRFGELHHAYTDPMSGGASRGDQGISRNDCHTGKPAVTLVG
jgi:hypothetical protein